MGKSSPPSPPNYQQAALQQGQQNIEAAKVQGQINNPNVVSPYGTQSVTWGAFDQPGYDKALADYNTAMNQYNLAVGNAAKTGGDFSNLGAMPTAPNRSAFTSNTPTLTQTLSPEQQGLYNQYVKTQGLLGGLGQQGAESLYGVVGKPVDFSSLPGTPGTVNQQLVDALMQRPMADYGRAKEQLQSDLAAGGIPVGSKAYNTQEELLGRQLTDAQTQASIAGLQNQEAVRRQAVSEMLAQRQVPLNEITALLSGSQVSNPFAVPGYAQNTSVGAAPTFAATNLAGQYQTDVYNAQQARDSALMSGLFGLAGTGMMAGGMAYGGRR